MYKIVNETHETKMVVKTRSKRGNTYRRETHGLVHAGDVFLITSFRPEDPGLWGVAEHDREQVTLVHLQEDKLWQGEVVYLVTEFGGAYSDYWERPMGIYRALSKAQGIVAEHEQTKDSSAALVPMRLE